MQSFRNSQLHIRTYIQLLILNMKTYYVHTNFDYTKKKFTLTRALILEDKQFRQVINY